MSPLCAADHAPTRCLVHVVSCAVGQEVEEAKRLRTKAVGGVLGAWKMRSHKGNGAARWRRPAMDASVVGRAVAVVCQQAWGMFSIAVSGGVELASRNVLDAMARKLAVSIPRIALTPAEAAAAIGVGPDFFDANVAPELRLVRRGRKRLVPVSELERWTTENAEHVFGGR